MFKKYLPIILGGGLVAYYFYKLKSAGDNIKVNLSSISVQKGKGFSLPYLMLKFNVQNITSAIVSINGIVGDIYLNDQYFANVSNLNKVLVPRNGSVIYEVKVQAGLLDVVSNLKAFLKDKKKKLVISADLKMNINDIIIPIKIDKKVI